MTKKMIIFDCDGVLVDSEFITSRVFAEALEGYGYSISAEECIRKFTGASEEACRQAIREETGITIPKNYWSIHEPQLRCAYEKELTPLMQPVLEILKILKIPRCIASNSPRSHILDCLTYTKQMNYFDETSIFSAQQVANAKPAPDLFLHAAKEMNVKPEDCIVIEDSSAGARAAIAAGMQVFMFLGGTHARASWYRDKLAVHEKPMMSNCNELLDAIQNVLGIE